MGRYDGELTEAQRKVLLPVWALNEVMTHNPSVTTEGYTCDEMGCTICNAGDEAEAVEFLVLLATEGYDMGDEQPPRFEVVDDRDILMALDDLAAELCD